MYVRRRIIHENNEPSMTKQEFAGETDINRIVQKFRPKDWAPWMEGAVQRNEEDYIENNRVKELHKVATREFNTLSEKEREKYASPMDYVIKEKLKRKETVDKSSTVEKETTHVSNDDTEEK